MRVSAPFATVFPGVYEIEALTGDTATICGDRQFPTAHLTETQDPLEGYVQPTQQPFADQIAHIQAMIDELQARIS